MCHENFFLRFGPHVTFINGTNGSGKSAILQGMQFCLGMQAAKTGRAGWHTDSVFTTAVDSAACSCVLFKRERVSSVPCSPSATS